MITDIQRRNQIMRRISRIPTDKLKDLDDYVSKLELGTKNENRTISFAGSWQDIDSSVYEDFTENLIKKRQSNRHRIDEKGSH